MRDSFFLYRLRTRTRRGSDDGGAHGAWRLDGEARRVETIAPSSPPPVLLGCRHLLWVVSDFACASLRGCHWRIERSRRQAIVDRDHVAHREWPKSFCVVGVREQDSRLAIEGVHARANAHIAAASND